MKRNLLLTVVSIIIIACVSSLLIVNPGWKTKETLYDNHYVIQVDPSNGTIGPMNLNSGDILGLSTTITSGKATLLIEQASVNPSLMTDWKRIIFNGTGSWQETLTVPANNKYLLAFLLNDNISSATINAACIREYTQHIIP